MSQNLKSTLSSCSTLSGAISREETRRDSKSNVDESFSSSNLRSLQLQPSLQPQTKRCEMCNQLLTTESQQFINDNKHPFNTSTVVVNTNKVGFNIEKCNVDIHKKVRLSPTDSNESEEEEEGITPENIDTVAASVVLPCTMFKAVLTKRDTHNLANSKLDEEKKHFSRCMKQCLPDCLVKKSQETPASTNLSKFNGRYNHEDLNEEDSDISVHHKILKTIGAIEEQDRPNFWNQLFTAFLILVTFGAIIFMFWIQNLGPGLTNNFH